MSDEALILQPIKPTYSKCKRLVPIHYIMIISLLLAVSLQCIAFFTVNWSEFENFDTNYRLGLRDIYNARNEKSYSIDSERVLLNPDIKKEINMINNLLLGSILVLGFSLFAYDRKLIVTALIFLSLLMCGYALAFYYTKVHSALSAYPTLGYSFHITTASCGLVLYAGLLSFNI